MATDILMPALSPTMEEGNLAKWLVKEGDAISAGQIIAEIETDKAVMEVEAVDEGVLEAIFVPAGAQGVKVNTPIARLRDANGAAQLQPQPVPTSASASAKAPKPAPMLAPVAAPAPPQALPRDAGLPMIKTSVRDALRDAMAEEMRRDANVFLIGEEVAEYQGAYKVSRGLLEEFGPKRVVDTPITEHGFAGLGVGAAMAGLRPIVEFMTFNFAMQAIDHLINSAAKTLYMSGGQITCPIVFRGPNGAASRVGAQHSQDYSSWYAHVPGLKVLAPYDAADAKGLLKSAIRDPNPIIFLEHEMLYGESFDVPDGVDWLVPIGKALIRRPGRDVTLVAHSRMVAIALKAAEVLAQEGIEAEVIDLRTLRPLDSASVVESVKRTNRLITVEEGWGPMGVGAEIVARVCSEAFDWLDAPPIRLHQIDAPLAYAANLERLALPQADHVIAAARTACGR